ncbi:portal protein [Mycobacterium phage Damien]|uniref:portal protein n=1 Tax=Mycobacterium phage Oaker TaxID=1445727 RepID=UPI0003E3D17C|nr:portal protein [Mycobacterium phage Oaker]YP_009043994.1 portal protein [Mycobacterium phage Damien]AHG24397.1 portal protein [Mycobacterium phage Oaker]AHZ95366.1 portal protein [Mycobacterium phage Damien]
MYNRRQYEVPQPFFGQADGNIVSDMDQKRIQAYDLYEDLYNNNHNSLKIVLRGEDALPVYLPSGRKIVNTTSRFLAKDMDYFVEAQTKDGQELDEPTRMYLEQYLSAFYKREGVKHKFSSNKKWGLVRADAVFMLVGDPNKNPGERLSLHEVDPRQIFEIDDPDQVGRIQGYYMVERVPDWREEDKSGKEVCRRTKWLREKNEAGQYTGKVIHDVTHWEIGKWDDRVLKAEDMEQVPGGERDLEESYLPDPISQPPIYIWNTDAPQNSTWGTSLLSGLETLIFALNQSITDEDLSLIMRGLGMYVTNAAPPVNPDSGEIMDWNVGPGQVIEISENQEFTNVTGVDSVSPFQDHMNFMDDKGLLESSGTPAVAVGKVDVAVAESGISLKLQLDPLLAANEDRELQMYLTMDRLHHDLVNMWIPAYEGVQTNNAVVSTVFGDPMPVNENQVIQDVVLLRTSNLILTEMAVDKLSSIGWKYPAGMSVQEIVDALAQQASDDAAVLNSGYGVDDGTGGFSEGTDEFGNEVPDTQTVDLGVT